MFIDDLTKLWRAATEFTILENKMMKLSWFFMLTCDKTWQHRWTKNALNSVNTFKHMAIKTEPILSFRVLSQETDLFTEMRPFVH